MKMQQLPYEKYLLRKKIILEIFWSIIFRHHIKYSIRNDSSIIYFCFLLLKILLANKIFIDELCFLHICRYSNLQNQIQCCFYLKTPIFAKISLKEIFNRKCASNKEELKINQTIAFLHLSDFFCSSNKAFSCCIFLEAYILHDVIFLNFKKFQTH